MPPSPRTFTHTYAAAGDYTAVLDCDDGFGGTGSDSQAIHAVDPPPPECTDLDGDGYADPSSTACTAIPATDCDDADASVHPGAAEINDGKDNDCNGQVDENNHPPTVTLTADPTSGSTPLQVAFTLRAEDADGDAVTCDLDFGDGQASGTITPPAKIAHTYGRGGDFTARTTCRDALGAEGRASQTVRVGGGATGDDTAAPRDLSVTTSGGCASTGAPAPFFLVPLLFLLAARKKKEPMPS